MSSLQSPYQVIRPQTTPMFALLLSSVVIAGGTYFLYQYLFGKHDDDETYGVSHDSDNKNEAEEEEEDNGGYRLRIFFGSQSGTAEGFAFDMEKETKKLGFSTKAIDLEDYDAEDLCNESLVIFLVATYGEGEATDNAMEFYNWLSSESDRMDDELQSIEFAVYGLGNSQYEFFNAMGKQFDKYLEQYGGNRIFERGEGDDDIGSIDDQFGDWKHNLYKLLCAKYLGIDEIDEMQKFECSLHVDTLTADNVNYNTAKRITLPYDLTNYQGDNDDGERINRGLFLPSRHKAYSNRIGMCSITNMYQLRQNTNDGSTLHIEFDLSVNDPFISYRTADNIGFIPRNNHKSVDKLCKRLKLNKNDVIRISPLNKKGVANYTFPQIISIQNLFLWFLDINGSPSKKVLSTLALNFTNDVDEKDSILKICDNVQQNIVNKHWNLLDVLNEYKSIEVDIASLIEILKPLQPRLYTISSSSALNPKVASVCIKLEQHGLFNGVQSNYFAESKVGNTFQFYIEESKFKLPSHSVPIIMIAVGAGLAPFAAFIDEGDAQKKLSKQDYGEWWLLFGCRYKVGDYIYKDKLQKSYKDKDGVLSEIKVAFSREQKKKVYVQHLIEEYQEQLWELIHCKHARVYVCGGVAMGKAVRETFIKIFEFYHKSKDGHQYLDNLLKHDIYVQELWG